MKDITYYIAAVLIPVLVVLTPIIAAYCLGRLPHKLRSMKLIRAEDRGVKHLKNNCIGSLYRENVYVSNSWSGPVVQNSDRVYTLLDVKETEAYTNSSDGPLRKCYKFKLLFLNDNTVVSRTMSLDDFEFFYSPANEDDKIEVWSI